METCHDPQTVGFAQSAIAAYSFQLIARLRIVVEKSLSVFRGSGLQNTYIGAGNLHSPLWRRPIPKLPKPQYVVAYKIWTSGTNKVFGQKMYTEWALVQQYWIGPLVSVLAGDNKG